MISCKAISSAGAASSYFLEHNGQQSVGGAEYYQNDEVRSSWGGVGSALMLSAQGGSLGMGAEVTREDLVRVLEGRVIDLAGERTGEERQLGKWGRDETGEKVWQHRAGLDLTFSAPKSVSLASEVWGRDDVRAAHEAGVQAAMDYLERHAAQTRINGEHVQTGNLVYARFEHSISRELDPQTHTHVLVANATNQNGEWYSLSNEKILDLRTTADLVYKNEMANHLERAGYRLEHDGKGGFEIAGASREQLEAFSQRSAQIESHLRAQGIDPERATHEQRQVACLATRAGKDAPDNAATQRAEWQERAKEAGISPPQRRRGIERDEQAGKKALKDALAHLTERQSAISEKELTKEIYRASEGRATHAQIEKAVKDAKSAGELIVRQDSKLTTPEMQRLEKDADRRLSDGREQHQAVMTAPEFDRALARFESAKGFTLSDEQRAAARMVLTGGDSFQAVQGLAGTGKTTMLEFVRQAAEGSGWRVEGHSNGAEQAAKMEAESGIRTTTTARHLIDQDKAQADRSLASAALETFRTRHGQPAPDFDKLARGIDAGTVSRAFDSSGRVYYTDAASGRTYTPTLYADRNTTTSRNLNHAGLTKTTYAVVRARGVLGALGGTTVLKTGGTLGQQARQVLDKAYQARQDTLFQKSLDASKFSEAGRRAAWAEHKRETSGVYAKFEKAGVLEGLAARAKIALENQSQIKSEIKALETQARQPGPEKVLRICDEASMLGQRDFNRVLDTTERAGARTVFLGDRSQHQSVGAGAAFERAQQHAPTAELGRDSIRRQITDEAKAAVGKILDGQHAEAVKSLPVREIRTEQDKVAERWEGKVLGAEYRAEMRQAATADNAAVIRALARDYAALPAQERTQTLVLTATNADRASINAAIRDEIKAGGGLQDGKVVETLQKIDRTAAELGRASSYQAGERIRFGHAPAGVDRGTEAEVVGRDTQANTVTARLADGREIAFNPREVRAEAYRAETREVASGDRILFTKNDQDTGFRNGERGTITKIDGEKLMVRMDSGVTRDVDLSQYKHLEHGYASTSHSAQGQTVNHAMIHHNTERGAHGDRETYVNVTRVRESATVYTQDRDKAAQQSGVRLEKETAHGKTAAGQTSQGRGAQPAAGKSGSNPGKGTGAASGSRGADQGAGR